MKFAIDSLSEINFKVLERLSKLLAGIVANSEKNKMSLPNILPSCAFVLVHLRWFHTSTIPSQAFDDCKHIVTCIAPTMRFTPAILTYSIVHHRHFFEADPVAPPEGMRVHCADVCVRVPMRVCERMCERAYICAHGSSHE